MTTDLFANTGAFDKLSSQGGSHAPCFLCRVSSASYAPGQAHAHQWRPLHSPECQSVKTTAGAQNREGVLPLPPTTSCTHQVANTALACAPCEVDQPLRRESAG